jgi:hypothetical protein
MGNKFAMKASVQVQLRTFAHLRAEDPEKAKAKYDNGEALVALSHQGKFMKLRNLIHGIEQDDILTYHVVKAYKAALLGGHLMIVGLFIEEGYPFNKAGVPTVLLEIMAEANDDRCLEIIEFLLAKGYDANLAAQGTWMTGLHVAIRYGHLRTAGLLLEHGADVNAVAEGDIMPLALAQKLMTYHNDKEGYVFCYTIVLPSFVVYDVSASLLSIYSCLLAFTGMSESNHHSINQSSTT